MDYKYLNYFPLESKKGTVGAYEFLIQEGFQQQVEDIKRIGYSTNARRLMVVRVICDSALLDKFLQSVWTQGDITHRIELIDKWNMRYDKREDIHKLWSNRYLY